MPKNWKSCRTCGWWWYLLWLTYLNGSQRPGKGTRRMGNRKTNWDYSNYSIAKISQNTVKSFGDLRTHTLTQTPVKDHQLTKVWRTCKDGSSNLGQTTRPSYSQQKTENLLNCGLCRPQNKIEGRWKMRLYLDLARELKDLWSMRLTVIPIKKWHTRNSQQRTGTGTEGHGIRGRLRPFKLQYC